tara:strand:- start:65 stop:535 length:471 start_codon:yes stop_codon:yes gene_type:complete
MRKLSKYFLLIFAIILVDQMTKYQANKKSLQLLQTIEVLPFLNFVFVTNKGISFGLLSDLNISLYLGILSMIISIVLFMWLKKSQDKIESLCISLIIAGAIGNGLNRIIDGYVIDFIDIFYKNLHWPSFNVADTSITCGVIIYFCRTFTSNTKEKK